DEDDNGNTYRAVYTVKFARVVYALHAFQKKSKSGVKTPGRGHRKGSGPAQGCGGALCGVGSGAKADRGGRLTARPTSPRGPKPCQPTWVCPTPTPHW